MHKVFKRLRALIYKETVQILRDRRTLSLLFLLPAIELFLFAYAVSLTVTHLPTALVDQSKDVSSREFTLALSNSSYFDFKLELQSEQQVIDAINAGTVKAGVVIPPNFAENIACGKGNALIILDGSDNFSVTSGYNAASAIAQKYSLQLTAQTLQRFGSDGSDILPITTSTRVLYNPDIRDLVFILPGLVALIIQNIIVAYSALAVVRERETGTLEQLISTPARPIELIIGKLIPATIVVILDMVFVLVLGVFWFGVPIKGSIFNLAILSLLFILSAMGLGLLISSVAKTQKQAQQLSAFVNVLTMLLTGFIFPRTTMPLWTRVIGDVIPVTYYLRIIRGIVTKGVGLAYLGTDTLALIIYSALALTIIALVSKKRLD
jgi:ABC-2 type transport system permease protein